MEQTNSKKALIAKYLENQCTPEEKSQLYELLISEEYEKTFREELFTLLNEGQTDNILNHSADFERIYKKLTSEINHRETKDHEIQQLQKRNKVKKLVLESISIAAVLCIVFFLGTIYGNNDTNSAAAKSNKYNIQSN